MANVEPEAMDALRAHFDRARRQQDEYFDTVANAALLAANQVQDKRIEAIENDIQNVGMSASQLFFDVVISASFGIGGILLRKATASIFKRVLRYRALGIKTSNIKIVTASPRIEIVSQLTPEIIKEASNIPFHKTFAISTKKVKQYTLYRSAIAGGIRLNLDPFKAFVSANLRNINYRNIDRAIASDTPGVAITDAALAFARDHKNLNAQLADSYDRILQRETLDEETWHKLQIFIFTKLKPPSLNFARVREHYKLLFEACIWAALYQTSVQGTKFEHYQGKIAKFVPPDGLFPKPSKKFYSYWYHRFYPLFSTIPGLIGGTETKEVTAVKYILLIIQQMGKIRISKMLESATGNYFGIKFNKKDIELIHEMVNKRTTQTTVYEDRGR